MLSRLKFLLVLLNNLTAILTYAVGCISVYIEDDSLERAAAVIITDDFRASVYTAEGKKK